MKMERCHMEKSALKWLQFIGKEQVQTFQDNFAANYNISLCLLTIDGEPLTVWSNESLLCYKLQKNNSAECISYRKESIAAMLKKREPIIEYCYTGLAYFLHPIFRDHEIIAFFIGGMVSLSEEKDEIFDKFSVNYMKKSDLENILTFLSSILSMIHMPEEAEGFAAHNSYLHTQLMKKYGLTEREVSIIDFLMKRKTNIEIAGSLCLSEKTVKTHVSNVIRKMNVKNRIDVMLICQELDTKDVTR